MIIPAIYKCLGAAPLIGIERRRIYTDGDGVNTLVGFHGCNLHCKYCLNPQSISPKRIWKWMTPRRLLKEVSKDEIYFLKTDGGICFGGGEPLRHVNFIRKFKKLCSPNWRITIETSLNVPENAVKESVGIVDRYIVDIKDVNPDIYKSYTGQENQIALRNLSFLLCNVSSDNIIVRVPLIPGYNSEKLVEKSVELLKKMGITHFDKLTYKCHQEIESRGEGEINVGKLICNFLKSLRRQFAEEQKIQYDFRECTFEGKCSGTCPACERELGYITMRYRALKRKQRYEG